jgi:hypothetical protein
VLGGLYTHIMIYLETNYTIYRHATHSTSVGRADRHAGGAALWQQMLQLILWLECDVFALLNSYNIYI